MNLLNSIQVWVGIIAGLAMIINQSVKLNDRFHWVGFFKKPIANTFVFTVLELLVCLLLALVPKHMFYMFFALSAVYFAMIAIELFVTKRVEDRLSVAIATISALVMAAIFSFTASQRYTQIKLAEISAKVESLSSTHQSIVCTQHGDDKE